MTTLDVKPAAAEATPRPVAQPAPTAAPAATMTPPVVPPPAPQRVEPRRPGRFRRFVRSVFSHLIFAAIVTAGVFGYMYQDMILGRVATTVCGNDALGPYYANGSKSASASPAATSPVSKPTNTPSSSLAQPAPASPGTAPASNVIAAKPADIPAQPVSEKRADAPKAAVSVPVTTPPATPAVPVKPIAAAPPSAPPVAAVTERPRDLVAVEPAPSPPTPVATPAKPTLAPPPAAAKPAAQAAVPATAPPSDPLTSAWRSAREAFNAGKPEAIDAYKSLLRAYPSVPDLAGELGNIYYAAGKWREASEHYYEAAQRYLKSPNPGYAACLLDVLRNLRSPDAERLAGQITRPCPTSQSGQPGQAGQPGQSTANPPRG